MFCRLRHTVADTLRNQSLTLGNWQKVMYFKHGLWNSRTCTKDVSSLCSAVSEFLGVFFKSVHYSLPLLHLLVGSLFSALLSHQGNSFILQTLIITYSGCFTTFEEHYYGAASNTYYCFLNLWPSLLYPEVSESWEVHQSKQRALPGEGWSSLNWIHWECFPEWSQQF